MTKRDYYDVLGAKKGDDTASLKRAYRKMAMKYHPDQNPNNSQAEAKFKEVNEAWEVLQDDQKRGAYDQYGHSAFEQGGGGAGGGFGGGGFGGGANFNDIFGDFFNQGGNRQPNGPTPGNDLRYNITISLEDAFNGTELDLEIATSIKCTPCNGSGAQAGSSKTTCSGCNGSGTVHMQQGFFTIQQTCPHCQGEGSKIEKPCKTCRGTGRNNGTKTLSAKIPAGVDDGMRIRLPNEGEAGLRGASNGDLYLFVSVTKHAIFERENEHIHFELPVAFTTASLGGTIEVPTIDGGRVALQIPEGTQTGTRFRVRGRGMPIVRRNGRGDMFVKVNVEIPKNLSSEQKDLLRQLDETLGHKNNPDTESVLGKIKNFWNGL